MEKAKLREKLALSHDHPVAADFRFGEERHTGVFTCSRVWTGGEPILFVSHDEDGDWQFLCAGNHGEASADDGLLVCLEHVVSRDPSVNELATMCAGYTATRETLSAPWCVEDSTQDNIRRTIDEHGWWVGLIPAEGDSAAFAYTIGLYETFGHPEIIVFGLAHESMHAILNNCGEMIRGGTHFAGGETVAEILKGYEVRFRAVTAEASYAEHLGYGCQHYGNRAFPVLQLLWPDKQHRFPGDAAAADFLSKLQPLLE